MIADELLLRIEEDNRSRQEWLDTRARGIEMLGLKIEAMRSSGPDGSAPLEGQSQIRASVLCEAVVRFGANAFSELCPTDGPAKVAEDTAAATTDLDDVADALETGLNHYLTTVDKPWMPDTDAMLLRIGVDGSVFKKVYHDPILRRPCQPRGLRRGRHRQQFGDLDLRRPADHPSGDDGRLDPAPDAARRGLSRRSRRRSRLDAEGRARRSSRNRSAASAGTRAPSKRTAITRSSNATANSISRVSSMKRLASLTGWRCPTRSPSTKNRERCWRSGGTGTKTTKCVCRRPISSSFPSFAALASTALASRISSATSPTASRRPSASSSTPECFPTSPASWRRRARGGRTIRSFASRQAG